MAQVQGARRARFFQRPVFAVTLPMPVIQHRPTAAEIEAAKVRKSAGLVGWLHGLLLVGWWMIVWFVVGWLVGGLVDWLVGWLANWFIGWFICMLTK